jgi:hypothetical protein
VLAFFIVYQQIGNHVLQPGDLRAHRPPLAVGGPVPHNIVFAGDRAVGIIGWDGAVAAGSRLVDFAHAVWCCADVCEDTVAVAEQSRKVALACDAYGWEDRSAVVDEIAARFRRARDGHAAAGRTNAAVIFEAKLAWMASNDTALKSGL